jgi:hypothetical protein
MVPLVRAVVVVLMLAVRAVRQEQLVRVEPQE